MIKNIIFFIPLIFFGLAHAQINDSISLTTTDTIKKVYQSRNVPLLTNLKADSLSKSTTFDKEKFERNKIVRDSIRKDSTIKDSIKRSKALIKSKISYKAKDYVTMDRNTEKIYFYNEAKLNYGNLELTGGVMAMDYNKREIYNGRLKDELGKYEQHPVFKQGGTVVKPDSIKFNYTTKKSVVWNSKTKQSDGSYLLSEQIKKENDSVLYTKNTYVTTSEDPDDPEYYFRIRKSKLIPNKKIITGVTNLYIEDVPTLIGLPFTSFPLGNNNSSGIIFPTYGQGGNRGFFLQNGGYYLTLGDYFDFRITGDYYTSASYGVKVQSSYKRRYKFSGSINASFENIVSGERGFDGYSRSNVWNIRWSHRRDQKAGPNSSFSASVNLGSSTYYRQSLNQLNTPNFLNNSLSSSISYSKNFPIVPGIRTSLTFTHNQNNNTRDINMTLPTFQGSLDRIYPFSKESKTKKGLIENINFQYSLNAQNRIQTKDSLFLTSKMFENARNGIQHLIPIATNFKLFKYISANMSTNVEDSWSFKTIRYNNYDPITKEVKKDTISGFDRFGKYSFSAGLATTIFGTFLFGKDRKIMGIRHVMRPSISFSYAPDQKQLYDNYVSDERGTLVEYTRFENSIYGSPSKTETGSIGFSISNDFEAKVRSKDTTKLEPIKVKFLSNFNISTSYNMLADSLKLSPITMGASTSLLKNKLRINLNATLDPYAIDANGRRINTPNISAGGGLFRLTSARANLSYGISSEELKKKRKDRGDSNSSTNSSQSEKSNIASGGRPDNLFGQALQLGGGGNINNSKVSDKEKPYYNYSIPWKINITQTISYTNNNGIGKFSANSIMFSGGFDPAPRWNISFNSGFDLEKKGFTFTQINFQRNLKSWQMTFSWTPTSENPTWYFFIGIKANIFRDIKFEERGKPDRRL